MTLDNYLVCTCCGRKSWSVVLRERCNMTQPDGHKCAGIFSSVPMPVSTPPKSPPAQPSDDMSVPELAERIKRGEKWIPAAKEPSDRELYPLAAQLCNDFHISSIQAWKIIELCRAAFQPQGEPVGYIGFRDGDTPQFVPTHGWPVLGTPLYASPPRSVADSLVVTVDKEGVRFGKNVWFAHEKICGRVAGVVASEYYKWVDAMVAAAPLPPPPEVPK